VPCDKCGRWNDDHVCAHRDVVIQPGVVVRLWLHENRCSIHFELFVSDYSEQPTLFWRRGSDLNADCTADVGEAEPFAIGFVKWDGCLEFEACRHFCGTYWSSVALRALGEVIEIAKAEIPPIDMARGIT
jgi:hypothetical protein